MTGKGKKNNVCMKEKSGEIGAQEIKTQNRGTGWMMGFPMHF